jgi:nucleoside-diphosphate-sugar epimerase
MPPRKLIIGCGYLGQRVARRWIAQGETVVALTRSAERARDIRASGIEPIIGDVTDSASLAELSEVETALYAVGLDRDSGKSMREVYVGGLENVLRHTAGKVGRFLYISSTSVYGQNSGEWVDESSECRPESENGKVCLEAESLLRSRIPEANILRLAGIYGPGRLVARVAALRAGLILDGNPDAWLNLIHVDDAVVAILACERLGTPGATYLVCDDQPLRRLEYYQLLASLIGASEPRSGVFPPSARGGPWESGDTVATAPSPESPPANLNKRCSNRRLHDELQITLRFPNVHIGLPMALTARADQFALHLQGGAGGVG